MVMGCIVRTENGQVLNGIGHEVSPATSHVCEDCGDMNNIIIFE